MPSNIYEDRAHGNKQKLRNEAYIGVYRNDKRCGITPKLDFLQTNAGFSYIGVLLAVAIVSIATTAANRYWSTLLQRERETELLYRGNQIRAAIRSYYTHPPAGQRQEYPRAREDLLQDPRFPQTRRHLRQWYPDPMTGSDQWILIRDAGGRIKGVHSAHPGQPLKRSGFPAAYRSFETAAAYTDWKFVFVPRK